MSADLKLEQQEGNVPSGWELVALNEVCALGGGKTPSKSNDNYWHGSIPWVSPKDFDGVTLDETEDHLTQAGVSENSINLYEAGDIAMVVRSGVLRHSLPVAQLKSDMAVNQDIKVLQPDIDKIISDYLINTLIYEANRIRASCVKTGTTVESVETAFLKAYKLPLPPLPEQRRIADILSTVDKQIEQTSTIIEKTRQLKQGTSQDLISEGIGNDTFEKRRLGPIEISVPANWDTVSLSEICTEIRNGFVGSATQYYTDDKEAVPYLQSNNVRRNKIDTTKLVRISEEFDEENPETRVHARNLLTVQSGHIGETCIVPDHLDGANSHAIIISRLKTEIASPEFVSHYINSAVGKKAIDAITVGSTVEHINVTDFRELELPLPEISEQRKIGEILTKIGVKIAEEKRKKRKLKELKRGVMQDLLTGTKRVNSVTVE